ncbi:MAG TPA: hypothetical protein VH063_07485 [Gaiellaceae bacterium]|jgi:hypothetical protein|nr:hypothetical protein [Gaiellaceae bacterium]
MESSDFDLVAASLRADSSDLAIFVEALATKLTASFPAYVAVERRRGLKPGPRPVRKITVVLGDDGFELEHESGIVLCRRRAIVRGIALRSEELELGPWIEALSHALVTEAERSEHGRESLRELLE